MNFQSLKIIPLTGFLICCVKFSCIQCPKNLASRTFLRLGMEVWAYQPVVSIEICPTSKGMLPVARAAFLCYTCLLSMLCLETWVPGSEPPENMMAEKEGLKPPQSQNETSQNNQEAGQQLIHHYSHDLKKPVMENKDLWCQQGKGSSVRWPLHYGTVFPIGIQWVSSLMWLCQ